MKEDLNRLSVDALGKIFPVILTEFNPEWKNKFTTEKELILDVSVPDKIIRIEHIGSTSVPGLISKPTIDILVEIIDDTDLFEMTEKLKGIGYDSIPRPGNPPPHLMFAKGYSISGYTGQTYHLHIRYRGDWDELVFRDFLRNNPSVADQYAQLKKRLSVVFRKDREEYTTAKTDFIRDVIKRAREELKNKPCF
jgi:GrpB-like predicted nucleotidyltransferase (UPF0157 family)